MVYQVPTPCFPKKDSGYGFNKKNQISSPSWWDMIRLMNWTGKSPLIWGELGQRIYLYTLLKWYKKFHCRGTSNMFYGFWYLSHFDGDNDLRYKWVSMGISQGDARWFFPHQIRSNCSNSNLKWTLHKMTITTFTVSAKCSLFFFFQLLITFSIKRNCM